MVNNNLVGGFNLSEKIWKSVGMIIPNIWKNKSHVPNHQPVVIVINVSMIMVSHLKKWSMEIYESPFSHFLSNGESYN